MNFRKRKRVASEVSTHSLNDIMFFLMLFFLIVSTLVNPNVLPLTLPKASNRAVIQKNVVVSIDDKQNFFVNRKPITMDKLEETIGYELAKFNPDKEEPVILVNADQSVPWGEVVRIMRIGKVKNAKVFAGTAPEN